MIQANSIIQIQIQASIKRQDSSKNYHTNGQVHPKSTPEPPLRTLFIELKVKSYLDFLAFIFTHALSTSSSLFIP